MNSCRLKILISNLDLEFIKNLDCFKSVFFKQTHPNSKKNASKFDLGWLQSNWKRVLQSMLLVP